MRTPRSTPDADASRLPAAPARGRRAHAGPPAEEDPAEAAAPPPRAFPAGAPAAAGPVRRQRLRPGTVRAKIVSLLMVPVVSLLALWAFATVSTAQDIARLGRIQRVDRELRLPLGAAVTALQAERRAAVRRLAEPGPDRAAALAEQGRRTDAAVARLRLGDRHTVADSGDHPAAVAVRLREFVAAAETLSRVRAGIEARTTGRDTAFEQYTEVVAAAFATLGSLTGGAAAEGAAHASEARVLLELARAREHLAREDAVLAGRSGRTPLAAADLRRFTAAAESRRTLTASAAADLPGAPRTRWQAAAKSAAYAALTAAEDRLLTAAVDPRQDADRAVPAGWDGAAAEVATAMRAVEDEARAAAADRSDPFAEGVLGVAGAAVLFGLAAVAASLVISVRIGRALVVELVALRNGALEIAHRKLPGAMERLRAGQEVDVTAEAPVGAPADDEIAQVGAALATVHRAALSAAVERAELASGVSGVFVNLARRSQVLVHRQLTLLDSMERRADDPGELGDLFRLDHLTTRMRRHAESLIILSGAAPGRAWRMPVPLTNVVRAAVSEIEDYPRVEVRQLAEAAVAGAAVADLTHLLAELIENATQFSPPHTKVRVSGEPVGNGYVLEVEDRGLGMGRGTLAEANRRIEQSEALDLFDSDRLGLFVVSRLSARHGVKVHLRTSPYGGTTAVVLLPTALLQGALPPGSRQGAGAAPEQPEPGGTAAEAEAFGRPATAASRAREAAGGGLAPGGAEAGGFAAVRSGAEPEPELRPGPAFRPGPVPAAGPGPGSAPSLRPGSAPAALPGDRTAAGPGARPEPPGPAGADRPAPEQAPAPVATLRPRGPGGSGPRTVLRATGPVPLPAGIGGVAPGGANGRPEPAAGVTDLPRRVRQASLVPQLREAPAPAAPASSGTGEAGDPYGRSPEEARSRMAAYRAGWARGAAEVRGTGPRGAAGSEGEHS
ncbi:nitrate- and nitrite sensing domain-containing protein [Streptomyces bambusae]|uniref:sensor histidine kinase n=1 Tax=Streptomyces bambusae TaxID=1550616 RepID=UPI001CFF2F02|nr:nitrate- and nitrite sensing domain-containing protein [Streptomyces bambusae]MCB5168398.1 nitrate- and nitrite sensing domain-containing protein [Streptomyces bambusae]